MQKIRSNAAKAGTEASSKPLYRSTMETLPNRMNKPVITTTTGRPNASQADPADEARSLLTSHQHQGFSRLIFWNGGFLYWRDGKYISMSASEVRALIVRSLNERFKGVRVSVVSDVLEQVRAASLIPGYQQPPSWLAPNLWKPEEILVASNSIIHLPSCVDGELSYSISSTPTLFTTSALDYEFNDTDPNCPCWIEFLRSVFPNERECIETLQMWFGYCLTADTRQQKILFMVGPKRSGKGTICRVLQCVVGPGNVCAPTLASLQTNFGLWPLLGKTVAIVSDARLSGRSDQSIITERLLSISGEDTQTIDRKNMEPLTVKLSTRFTIVSNELPRLQDSSGALVSRMILIPFSRSFFGQEDMTLTERLLAERDGILHWAIEGWRLLRERGTFQQPVVGRDLLEQMEELSSPIANFVEERCEVDECYSVSIGFLYTEWCKWCMGVGKDPGTSQVFGRDLRAFLPRIRKRQKRSGGNRERIYEGIRLLET